MQSVAQALVARGHDVIWLTSADNRERVAASGATFKTTSAIALEDIQLVQINDTGLLDGIHSRLKNRLLAQVDDYRGVLREFSADILLVNVLPFGARALYDLGEIPVYATLGVIPLYASSNGAPFPVSGKCPPLSWFKRLISRFRHWVRRWLVLPFTLRQLLNRQRHFLGLRSLPFGEPAESFTYSPFLHIQASSSRLEFHQRPRMPKDNRNIAYVGPLVMPANDPTQHLPVWWNEVINHSQVIGITQGTLAMDPTSLIMPALEALQDNEKALLVVVSPHIEKIQQCFPNITNAYFAKWLPYHALLPHLSLLITNGGYGSITQALARKVPLLCAGQTEDKKDTAARVAWVGAGMDLKTDNPTAKQVKDAALQILCDEKYRIEAAKVGEELSLLGGGEAACDALENLYKSYGAGVT
jgi:UDP:flavonoid glycosyltransferase YjiC (YdhE family)